MGLTAKRLRVLDLIKLVPEAIEKQPNERTAEALRVFNGIVPEIRPFVFNRIGEGQFLCPVSPEEVDAFPFQTCSFEAIDNGPLFIDASPHIDPNGVAVRVMVVHEVSPGSHIIFMLFDRLDGRRGLSFAFPEETTNPGYAAVLQNLLSHIRSERLATERVNFRANRTDYKGRKTPFSINSIVRVVPKKEIQSLHSAFGGSMDFSHRWEVMGHWRRVSGVGKDRDGKYGVKEFTWVVPHMKGPDDMPVIKKIRLVRS